MSASEFIRIENLSFQYANSATARLENITLGIRQGECVLFTGKSGCGKTTLLRAINGLIPQYYSGTLSGTVHIGDMNPAETPFYTLAGKLSTVFQNPRSQFFNLDTTSEVLFPLENRGLSKQQMSDRLVDVCSLFRIDHLLERDIFQLSGGEKQILAIASAYAADTDIIVLDEPTSNLDLAAIETIRHMLLQLKAVGKTILIAEHRLSFLQHLVDRVVYLADGRIEHLWTQEEFIALSDDDCRQLGLRSLATPPPPKATPVVQRGELCIDSLTCQPKGSAKPLFALNNVNFPEGGIIGLVGPNGSGKSSLARLLTGTAKAKESRILQNGTRLSAKARLHQTYMVLQDVTYQLFTESVRDEVLLGSHKGFAATDADDILAQLNLRHLADDHPLSLSGGEKQRVSIAAGVSTGSRIMIFDEPTSGMDRAHMEQTAAIINQLKAPDRVILLISHDMEFLSFTADSICLLQNGRLSQVPLDLAHWHNLINTLSGCSPNSPTMPSSTPHPAV